jgi:oxalate---CoA ligase
VGATTDCCGNFRRLVFHFTGDMGHLDSCGNLILGGRAVDEINKGGMKIQPQDVENAVEGFPELSDVCAFAIDDELYGQNLALAFVLLDGGPETMVQFYRWVTPQDARGVVSAGKHSAHCAG